MPTDTTLKKEAPKETTPSEKVEEQIDIRHDLTQEEAQRLIDMENGVTVELPESQVSKIEKTEDKKEEKIEEPKVELPERYKGKSPEELAKLLDEKEKYIQSRSDEIGEWKKKLKEADELKGKITEIEDEAIKDSVVTQLPKKPQPPVITDTEYYDDPVKAQQKQAKYNQELLDYIDQITSAKTAPLYHTDIEKRRDKVYSELEEKYKDYPVKLDRAKIQDFLDKNPLYFKKYKREAYEKAYHDLSAPEISLKQKEVKEQLREQVKKELLEEMKNQSQAANIGLSDLETPKTGSSPQYDTARMEEDPAYNAQVLADMEKRAGR